MRLIKGLFLFFSLMTLCSCSQPVNKATTGAATGTALGAGLGAIVGSQSGNAGAGVAIGAAAGALGGALLGNSFDQQDQENQKLRSGLDAQRALIEENQRLIDELKKQGADVTLSDRGVVVNLPDVLFDFNSRQLRYDAVETVRDIGKVVTNLDRVISVEGHTDSVGSVTYNKRLSIDRAESVARELEAQGVNGALIRVRGFGEGSPIVTNNTEEGRARNRRVEVIIENN